jgi:hypothetical protein
MPETKFHAHIKPQKLLLLLLLLLCYDCP